jgi:NAD(P)-dependent dehydrogenase (short-subunit alcohol dehydrogenase family)
VISSQTPLRRIALVTGAGSGIGRAAALALMTDGFEVVLVGRTQHTLDEVAAEGRARNFSARVVPADVSDETQVQYLFGQIEEEYGRLDVLFNNAGAVLPGTPIDMLSLRQWQTVINVNLTGTFLCARAAFTLMKRQSPRGGRIINNGSVSAHTPRPNSTPYTASKHGVTGLTKSLALDGRNFDIACGQIDIGNTESRMTGPLLQGVPQANGTIAPEPVIATDIVAKAVAYMASLPLDANVLSITVMPTKMPLVGRG